MKTGIISRIALLLMVPFFFAACSRNADKGFYGSGTLEATQVLVSSQANGTIMNMNVDEGDPVNTGQVIAVVDSEKLALQKKQLVAGLAEVDLNMHNMRRSVELAKENLDNTQKKYDRIAALYKEGSTTQQNYDDINTALSAAKIQHQNAQTSLQAMTAKKDQLKAQLALLERQLSDCVITSPVNGTVLEKLIDAGELAHAGSGIATVADIHDMWIKVYVTEAELGRIKLGQAARLETGIKPPQSFSGKVAWISPRAEFTPKNVQTREARADLVYAVKVTVDNPDGVLKIGMPGEIYFDK